MTLPSYARATASSASKASPRSSKTIKDADDAKGMLLHDSKTSQEPNKRSKGSTCPNQTTPIRPSKPSPVTPEHKNGLKRPSLLTPHQKDNMAYKRNLYHITPRDTSKPCPLANLPSELRTLIYQYALPSTHYVSSSWAAITQRKQHVLPALLHVSRAISIEAAYTYFTHTTFHFSVRNLDFSPVIRWLEHLAPPHRALLVQRRHSHSRYGVEINVLPSVKSTYSWPPKGWLFDGFLEQHWRACQPFGNIYTVQGELHQMHFVLFCRLIEWWRWWGGCMRGLNGDGGCKYVFEQSPFANPFGIPDLHEEAVLKAFLSQSGMVVAMPCVNKAWKRNRNETTVRVMRGEGVRFFDALDNWYKNIWEDRGNKDWDAGIKKAKRAMERW